MVWSFGFGPAAFYWKYALAFITNGRQFYLTVQGLGELSSKLLGLSSDGLLPGTMDTRSWIFCSWMLSGLRTVFGVVMIVFIHLFVGKDRFVIFNQLFTDRIDGVMFRAKRWNALGTRNCKEHFLFSFRILEGSSRICWWIAGLTRIVQHLCMLIDKVKFLAFSVFSRRLSH